MNFTADVQARLGAAHRPDAVPAAGARRGRRHAGPQAGAGDDQHDLPRRRLRPPHRRRLHRAGGGDLEGGRRAGEAGVDARGRHDARLLPADRATQLPAGLDAAASRWRSSTADDVAVGDARHVPRLRQGRRRPVHDRGGARPVRHPEPARHVVIHDTGVRVGYWRSVSHALNAFANESFIDELAAAAGKDPVPVPPCAARQAAALPARARAGGRQGGLGQAAAGRAARAASR